MIDLTTQEKQQQQQQRVTKRTFKAPQILNNSLNKIKHEMNLIVHIKNKN